MKYLRGFGGTYAYMNKCLTATSHCELSIVPFPLSAWPTNEHHQHDKSLLYEELQLLRPVHYSLLFCFRGTVCVCVCKREWERETELVASAMRSGEWILVYGFLMLDCYMGNPSPSPTYFFSSSDCGIFQFFLHFHLITDFDMGTRSLKCIILVAKVNLLVSRFLYHR